MKAICGRDFLEKQPIACHRIVNPRARKNQSVVATKGRNHNRSSHAHRAHVTEDSVQHRHGHAILRRVLDFRKRQHGEIGKIGQQIKCHHDTAPYHERAHEIFSWIAHFAADECHIRPRSLRKQRADHRSSKD